jgi:hypothetical protein
MSSFITLLIGLGLLSPQAKGQDPERVKEAIESAKRSLMEQQNRDGSWPSVSFGGDPTALCTLALLTAGELPTQKNVALALTYLRARPSRIVYEVSLELMVFAAAAPEKDLDEITERAKWLVDAQVKEGAKRGMWDYGGKGATRRGGGDNSNSQFALLGLYEADRALKRFKKPSPIPQEVWTLALEHWAGAQNADGSWGYVSKGDHGYGSMTCAGIASLVIASGQLHGSSAALAGETVQCCRSDDENKYARRVREGLDWLGGKGRKTFNANPDLGQTGYYYYMYALERVGRLTAQRFIGDSDWYREGIQQLMRRHARFRGWADGKGHGEDNEHVATSFALLFLAKGNRPILIGKLKYGAAGGLGAGKDDWNNHPSDALVLTQLVEHKWKRDLSWYVINAGAATADDYQHAPVIYISGSQALPFMRDPDQAAKVGKALREYIDRGGFIYAEACCDDSAEFDRSFRDFLLGPVFENVEANKFDDVRDDHEVWFYEGQDKATREKMMEMYGGRRSDGDGWLEEIRRGCRTAVIYCSRPPKPRDANVVAPSCYWELQAGLGRDGKLPAAVEASVNAALELGVNIMAYATGRKVKAKIDQLADDSGTPTTTSERAVLDIRQAIYDGSWNAAPGALKQLQRKLQQHAGIPVPTDRREIEILDPKLFDHHMIFLHGRGGFAFSDKQREQLRMYVERGGIILADAVCASKAFDGAFREEMKQIFKGKSLQAIPTNHKMYTPEYGGFDLAKDKVKLRQEPRAAAPGQPLRATERETMPELEGLTFEEGRYGVIYSKYDLSCSLEGQKSVKCPGYDSEDAAKIGVNIVLYSLAP